MNPMYSINGEFGKVRIAQQIITPASMDILFYFVSAGWHQCNSNYRIRREKGCSSYLILMTVSGLGHLQIENQAYHLTSNTVAVVPPCLFHEYYAGGDDLWEFYWIHLDERHCRNILNFIVQKSGYVFSVHNHRQLTDGIEDLLFLNSEKSIDFEIEISSKISQFIHLLLSGSAWTPSITNNGKELTKQVIAFIEKNYKNPVSITDISKQLYLSTAHMIRVFKAKTGYSPYEYLNRYRILIACELLKFTNMPIQQISAQVGFKNTSNFISNFKKIKLVTPTVFRESNHI